MRLAGRLIYAHFVHFIFAHPASLDALFWYCFLTLFSDLGLAQPVQTAVDEAGYTQPTPIQAKAIPVLLQGRDLVGIAQTGTGKTAAFVLPLLTRLAASDERAGPRGCRALILAPTRELAAQIGDSIATYSKHLKLSHTVIVGGVKPRPQIKRLEPGVDILVATPGRLLDHAGSGVLRLDKIKTVVLDEADQMMDLGFMPAIRQIMSKLRSTRQTLLFSATMPKPIRQLANQFLTDPAEIAVTPQSKPVERIEQSVILVERADKRDALRDILAEREVERAIVFSRTKHGANRIVQNLGKDGLEAVAIHGNKSQNQREKALEAFKSGDVKIMVATDIAARGIDIDNVSHVVNFDLPNVPEVYVHRIGRTARAGTDGIAISLVEMDDRILLRDIEKTIGFHLTPEGAELHCPKPAKKPQRGRGGQGRSGGGQRQGSGQGKPNAQRSQAGHKSKPADASGNGQAKRRPRRRPRKSGAAAA